MRRDRLLLPFQLLVVLVVLLPPLGRLEFLPVSDQTGDGCGHSVLTASSGTLTSKNYPGTYPNSTFCQWRIRGAAGRQLTMAFGDMDIEASEQCKSGFLMLSSPPDGSSFGPYCSYSNPPRKVLVINSTSVTILFNSTMHHSGRGFLLSYASGNRSDLISCLKKGIHYDKELIKAYCPAGCKGVTGDIWGNMNQGYRDTSVLCKAAVHAGVMLDEQGGEIMVSQGKGITIYESTYANGLYSKRGSLSEKRLIFHKACTAALDVVSFSASSCWHEPNAMEQNKVWVAEQAALDAKGTSWASDQNSADEWLEISLGGRRNITGIITKGSSQYDYYVKTYQILSSRDGKNWKVYRSSGADEDKIFVGNSNSHETVYNAFIPPILARYLRIIPQNWNQRIALKVALLGCQPARLKSLHPYSDSGIHRGPMEVPGMTSSPAIFTTVSRIAINSAKTGPPLLVMLLIGGFVLISSAILLLVFLCHKKSRKIMVDQDCGLIKGYPALEVSQKCSRESLHLSTTEITSFPGAEIRVNHSTSQSPEYAEPDVIQVSPPSQTAPPTFKPDLKEGRACTLPLLVNHYDVPGKRHEYAEPLPPEPEYATPFVDQQPTGPKGHTCLKNPCVVKVIPSSLIQASSLTPSECLEQYAFPTPQQTETLGNKVSEAGLGDRFIQVCTRQRESPGRQPLNPRDGFPPAQQECCSQLSNSPYREPL